MGALPKRKSSKARILKRRSRDKKELVQLTTEKLSNTSRLPHRISMESGMYKGKKILKVK